MATSLLKENTIIPDKTFPINVFHTKGFKLHWHDHMEWFFVRRGRARIQIDASSAQLQQGEFVFVNRAQLHSAAAIEDGTELVAIVFNEALLRNSGLDSTDDRYFSRMANQGLQLPNFLKAQDPLTLEISGAVARIIDEFELKKPGFELLIKAELFRIFGLVFRHDGQLAAPPKARRARERDFTRLLQHLRQHFHEPVSLKKAADMVNMSPNHFCATFRKVTGKTLTEYLHMLKVNEARRLLLESEATITEIAESVGLGSPTYFDRVFKKYCNQSPSNYRKLFLV